MKKKIKFVRRVLAAYLCLNILFVRRVNILVAWDFSGCIEHIGATLVRFRVRIRRISMAIIKFSIFQQWNGIYQPRLIERLLTIITAKFTFGHFATEIPREKKVIWKIHGFLCGC